MDQGLLVPDELVVDLVVDRVSRMIARMVMFWMVSREQYLRQKHLIKHWQAKSETRWIMQSM